MNVKRLLKTMQPVVDLSNNKTQYKRHDVKRVGIANSCCCSLETESYYEREGKLFYYSSKLFTSTDC